MFDLLLLKGVTAIGYRTDENDHVVIVATANLTVPESCHNCHGSLIYKHGKRTYQYMDTPIHGKPTAVEIERQRYRCHTCGTVVTPELPDLDDKRIATKRLVSYIQDRCFKATFTSLAQDTGLQLNTVKAIALDYTEWLAFNSKRITPRILGIDEIMVGGVYRTVIANLEMNTIYDIREKRTLANLTSYFQTIHDRERIEWIATDMWGPYKSLFSAQAPQAKFVIDKFHVVRMASKVLDSVRISLQRSLSEEEALILKKHIRWSLLKGKKKRNEADWEVIEHIRQYHPRLAIAFDLKETFYAIYENDTRQDAEKAFEDWESSIPVEYKKQFGSIAKTVRRHHNDIFNYFDCPITNAYTEAFNGVTRVVNRMGRGYSYEILRAKLMYSKVARQSGQLIGTRDMIKEKTLLLDSTNMMGQSTDYGTHIPTLEAISAREDLD